MTIAGHIFDRGVCSCGRRWTDIRNATADDIDQHGVAHVGKLSSTELEQIIEAAAREDVALEAAMEMVA